MADFIKALLDWLTSLFRTPGDGTLVAQPRGSHSKPAKASNTATIVLNLASKSKKRFDIGQLVAYFDEYAEEYGVNTDLRKAHFWAQAAHETGGFQWKEELGNAIYFIQYDGRLGNTRPGDGYKYRGRGIFQLTGKYNYIKMGNALDLDLVNNPDLASEEETAVRIALQYWEDRNINRFADKDDIDGVTKAINGGFNGIASRIKYLKKAKEALKI